MPGRTVSLMLGVLLLGAFASGAHAYTLVLTDGQRVELVAEPTFRDGWADVQAKDGRRARLPVIIVSWTATNAANGKPAGYRSPGAATPKVWTNADIAPMRRTRLSLVGEPSATGSGPAGPVEGEGVAQDQARMPSGDAAGASESEWRARARAITERIEANEQQIAALESQEQAWESVARSMPNLSSGAASELAQVREALATARADQAAARASRAALEDEARRTGVPPGWLR